MLTELERRKSGLAASRPVVLLGPALWQRIGVVEGAEERWTSCVPIEWIGAKLRLM